MFSYSFSVIIALVCVRVIHYSREVGTNVLRGYVCNLV